MIFLPELCLARLLQRRWTVWFSDSRLQIWTSSQVARSQINTTCASWLLHCLRLGLHNLLLGGDSTLKSHHLRSLTHLKHLVLWWSHLFKKICQGVIYYCELLAFSNTYIEDLVLSFRGFCRLILLDLSINVVNLSAYIIDDLSLKLLYFLRVGVAAHQAEKFHVIVEGHVYN